MLGAQALEHGTNVHGRALAQEINLLRDRLDEALFGHQDYALIGTKPAS